MAFDWIFVGSVARSFEVVDVSLFFGRRLLLLNVHDHLRTLAGEAVEVVTQCFVSLVLTE